MKKTFRTSYILMSILMVLGIFTNITIAETIYAFDNTSSRETEKELQKIVATYGEENIIFQNAISIGVGEEVNIADIMEADINFEEVKSNNDEILKVAYSKVTGINEGTTFIIARENNNYHVMEIYVADNDSKLNGYSEKSDVRNKNLVYIDAGHGGSDPGAIGNGIKEKELNLKLALKVRDKLKAKGVQVVMNRESDVYVNYKDTAAHANRVKPTLFVSIHNNSSTSSSANGIETFYTKSIDKALANEVHSRLIKNTGALDRKVKWDTYYVTNHTTMPAILLENGFLSNAAEAKKLKTSAYQDKIVNAIVDGILQFVEINDWVNSWASNEIKYGMDNAWVEKADIFRPEDDITRAEFIKIVNKAFGFKNKVTSENFTDVKSEDWWYSEVLIALKNEYITGKNVTFRPNDKITREEVASIVTSIKKNKDINLDKVKGYVDFNKVSIWAQSSVEGAIEAGYMGKGSTSFRPKENITRAEAIVTLYRIVK